MPRHRYYVDTDRLRRPYRGVETVAGREKSYQRQIYRRYKLYVPIGEVALMLHRYGRAAMTAAILTVADPNCLIGKSED